MSTLLKAIAKKQSVIKTENGAKTFSTSLSACLDLFFMGGAYRNRSEQELISLFSKAYYEDKDTALKLLAYIRDCRGGMGERRFFRVAIKHLADNGSYFNIGLIPELGRWDDLFVLLGTKYESEVLDLIVTALDQENGLCAKWMPRQGKIANKIRKALDDAAPSPKEYRKMLVGLTKVVETQMCNKEWTGINYSHVPSMANVKYNKAFLRNDEARRREFLAKAVAGEAKINSSVAFPHDIIGMMVKSTGWSAHYYNTKGYITPERNDTAIAMWNQLPNYLEGNDRNLLVMADTSGSMTTANGVPLRMSIALAMYISERSNGIFKDAYLTFDANPELVYTKGNIYERLTQMKALHPSNTNLEAAFSLVLDTANKNKISKKEMPTEIIIVSDMEFDKACRKANATLFKSIRAKYKDSGYTMPNIIFWNVNSRQDNVPVRFNQDGVGLVSGASPAVIQAIFGGEINPMDIMQKAIDKDKYKEFAR